MFTVTITIALYSCATIALFYVGYQLLFLLLSVVFGRDLLLGRSTTAHSDKFARLAILIPAHNEEELVGGLLRSIGDANYDHASLNVYVIADNCVDRTASIARDFGVNCLERNDLINKGKPHALAWALEQISPDSYDAIIILDADSLVDAEFFGYMNDALQYGAGAIQGYFGVMNPDENWLTRLSILPGIMKFYLHFPGKQAVGLSCPLAGNAMCFTRRLIDMHGWSAFSIAENWEYYAILAADGEQVFSQPRAVIYSQVANRLSLGYEQRIRWMRGRADTLRRYWKPLVGAAWKQRSLMCIDCLWEIARPAPANLAFILVSLVVTGLSLRIAGFPIGAGFVGVLIGATFLYALSFAVGLVVQRAPLQTWLALMMVPLYIVWKAAISFYGAVRKDRGWVRTERNNNEG